METQVSSYVRHSKPRTVQTNSLVPAVVLITTLAAVLAIYLWPVVLTVAAVVAVRMSLKYYEQSKVEPEPEVVPEAPKQKRGYHKRLVVRHYQIKKPVVM